ncbi:hypothetical protein [Endozoicomonas sp. 8E]|uniref:hypothetical protein n=1 Tax=Endozoicomonas sp. 8E TaxID=3035692 RepID=UPI002939481C|nr:hypothetical protein [Endozoicomonas sp. 8E]WOG29594.1 hypothetical protein P6910_08060 [Endozoicomonas sp. 8E]
MRNIRPNALSLAVAAAISSFIIATDALANRRLQTKSVDISGGEQVEFTQSEVIVKPTLDDDSQPIPKSFTTTYPDQTQVRAGYDIPSEGFTDVFSGIEGGVAIVDQFETGENDVAQKYTKVLKVDNKGVFRFTHNLAEEKLLIEVSDSMTHQDSIRAVRAQSGVAWALEPFTGMASPDHLVGILKGANERAGNPGEADNYVVLATLEVDKMEVDGRTFMRLIAAGDRPPELQRLGQSLFVDDEVLLAAATSAYTQVHVLRKEIQQDALEDLLSHHKPIGYVVHVEDETQVYPVPAGYPRLEVTETPGDVVVFHGQKQNPSDMALVGGLYMDWWRRAGEDDKTTVKKDKVKSYQHTIRNVQMIMLEDLAARHDAGLNFGEEYDDMVFELAYSENLLHALTSATSDGAEEVEFALKHVEFTSTYISPTWVHIQLLRHFGFRPVLRNLLTNQHFVQDIHETSLFPKSWYKAPYFEPFSDSSGHDEGFEPKVIGDFIGQLLEMESELEKLRTIEAVLIKQSELRMEELNQYVEDQLAEVHGKIDALINQIETLQREVDQIPLLKKQVHDARTDATKARNTQTAAELGIDNWDEAQPLEEQARLITKRINEIYGLVAATAEFQKQALEESPQSTSSEAKKTAYMKARYANIALHLNILDFDINADVHDQEKCLLEKLSAMHAQQALQRQQIKTMGDQLDIQQAFIKATKAVLAETLGIDLEETMQEDPTNLESMLHNKLFDLSKLENELKDIRTPGHPKVLPEVLEKLTAVEKALNMDDLDSEDDLYYRRDAISVAMQTYITRLQAEQEALVILKTIEEILNINFNEGDDKATRLERVRTKLDSNDVSEAKFDTIEETLWKEDITPESDRAIKRWRLEGRLTVYVEDSAGRAIRQHAKLLKAIEDKLQIYSIVNDAAKERGKAFLAKLANDLGLQFKNGAHLSDNKYDIGNKILALMEELEEAYGNEDVRRGRNNEIAHQLNIEDYKDDASIEDQNILIQEKLQQLDEEVFKAGEADVDEHVSAIENELDRQMARLGPKPRYVLDREVATARRALKEANSEHEAIFQKQVRSLSHQRYPDEGTTLNLALKQSQICLGLSAGDKQTDQERMTDITRNLLKYSVEARAEIINELKAKTNLNVWISSYPDSGEATYSIQTYPLLGRDATGEDDKAWGQLPFTRKKYSQVTEFLREHDKKATDLANAMTAEVIARENLARKEQELFESGDINEKSATSNKIDMDPLNSDLNDKSETLSNAKQDLEDHDALLETTEKSLGLKPGTSDTRRQRLNALRDKQLQLGGNDGTGGKIGQLIQEEARKAAENADWIAKLAASRAEVERTEKVLKAAEEAVKNSGEPFQYTPKQAKVLKAIHTFTDRHLLKKQALEAAMGLAESAVESGNTIPCLKTFDFNDEFAPIRLQALAGDQLTFKQASHIVEVFKSLETIFRKRPFKPAEYQFRKAIEKVQILVQRARNEIKTASQQYDDEIHGISSAGVLFVEHVSENQKSFSKFCATGFAGAEKIRAMLREGLIKNVELENYIKALRGVKGYQISDKFEYFLGYKLGVGVFEFRRVVRMLSNEEAEAFIKNIFASVTGTAGISEHQPWHLKSLPEYFASHSASANKIMALLRDGLISKVELENYMKAVRGVDGYQTVAEFEHFLGYKHGVRVPEFRKAVQMLSDESAEAFMHSVFAPVTVTASGPAGMKESVAGMKEYAAAVIANYVLDDIAFENGRRTAAFLTNIQDTLTPYASAVGLSESDLIKAIHDTLMQAHAAAVEWQLKEYWVKPSAFLVQAATWYFSSYKPLLATHTVSQATAQSLSNMSYLYLLDLTNRGDYLHRMLTPFRHWLERFRVDLDRTGQYAYHSGIEQISEVGGLAMPLGKAASSVILLKTGSALFARQHNANPHRYRSISRVVPEIVKSMGSGQGIQVPLLHRATPQKVKTLASATAGLVLGPVATVGTYAHGLISEFTYAQTFGLALASSLTFDFFMNDNKMLTQWLGGPLGRSLDKINRWRGLGETDDEYLQRTAIASPQGFSETDAEYASRVKANNTMYGWTRHENYLQFRERRERTMKLFENGWEKYFRENVPKWSFSHAESIPHFYTLGALYEWQKGGDQKVHGHDKRNASQSSFPPATSADHHDTGEHFSLPE